MMDLPTCETCGRVIGPNEDSIEITSGTMRYHACGDFSVTGLLQFFHSKCGIAIECLTEKRLNSRRVPSSGSEEK